MTLQQLQYAVDVEESGSITKTAAKLFLSQPNLSTALKELEAEIGITVFRRSSKGVEVTAEGAQFISYAKSILAQVDKMEFVFKNPKNATSFVVACIRSSYMARLFCQLYNQLPKDAAVQLSLYETTPAGVFEAVADSRADVGKISFMESEYQTLLARAFKNRIMMEPLWKVRPYILLSSKSPLAKEQSLTPDILSDYTQVIYGDFADNAFRIERLADTHALRRRIKVGDRGTMMDILSNCHDCYIWTTSTHPDILRMHELTAIPCDQTEHIIEAVIYHKHRSRSKETQWLIETYRVLQFSERFLNQEPCQPQTML